MSTHAMYGYHAPETDYRASSHLFSETVESLRRRYACRFKVTSRSDFLFLQ